MRAVVQRVTTAEVQVDGERVGAVAPGAPGLLVLLGAGDGDDEGDATYLAKKIAGLRVFEDDSGRMNLALTDVGGSLLVVSQFTLYGDTSKGRRPSFVDAARPEQAEPLIEDLCRQLESLGARVATGRFRADMDVEIHNDGPITLMIEV